MHSLWDFADALGISHASVSETVKLINSWLERNRKAAAIHAVVAEAA
ncbi:MAG: hypothetical protein IH988_06335 [Planctomycetes bacterium]|nr:hypothetical protein [Planctomycetota bacterium]